MAHHALGLPSGWWERTQFEVMPWKDSQWGERRWEGERERGEGAEEAWESCYRYFGAGCGVGCYEEGELFFLFRLISKFSSSTFIGFIYTYVHGRSCAFCGLLLLAHLFSFWGPLNLDGEPLSQRFLHICTYVHKRPAFAEYMHTRLVWCLPRHQIRDGGGLCSPSVDC